MEDLLLILVTTNNLEIKIRIENKQAVVHVVGEERCCHAHFRFTDEPKLI
jgi:hypothetical protein